MKTAIVRSFAKVGECEACVQRVAGTSSGIQAHRAAPEPQILPTDATTPRNITQAVGLKVLIPNLVLAARS